MKKAAIFLICCLSLFSLCASESLIKSLHASLRIVKVPPAFTIYGGLYDNSTHGVVYSAVGSSGSSSTNEFSVPVNLSEQDVTVYVKVVQSVSVSYFTHSGFDLSISATRLILNGTDTDNETDPPVVVEGTYLFDASIDADGNGTADFTTQRVSTVGTVVTYRVAYPSGTPVPRYHNNAEVIVGGFAYRWTHDDNLIPGTYKATITLQYTVNE